MATCICVLGEKFHLRLFNDKAPHSLKLERKVEGYQVRIPDKSLKTKLEEIRMQCTENSSNNQEVHTYLLLFNPATKLSWSKNPIIFCMGLSHKDAWFSAFLRCLQITNNGYQLTMSIIVPDGVNHETTDNMHSENGHSPEEEERKIRKSESNNTSIYLKSLKNESNTEEEKPKRKISGHAKARSIEFTKNPLSATDSKIQKDTKIPSKIPEERVSKESKNPEESKLPKDDKIPESKPSKESKIPKVTEECLHPPPSPKGVLVDSSLDDIKLNRLTPKNSQNESIKSRTKKISQSEHTYKLKQPSPKHSVHGTSSKHSSENLSLNLTPHSNEELKTPGRKNSPEKTKTTKLKSAPDESMQHRHFAKYSLDERVKPIPKAIAGDHISPRHSGPKTSRHVKRVRTPKTELDSVESDEDSSRSKLGHRSSSKKTRAHKRVTSLSPPPKQNGSSGLHKAKSHNPSDWGIAPLAGYSRIPFKRITLMTYDLLPISITVESVVRKEDGLIEDEIAELYSSPFQFSKQTAKYLQDRETKAKTMLLDLAIISQETPFSLDLENSKKPDHQKLFDAIKKGIKK